jgi:succinate dehydrogenase / fumarate reductase, cytochrome b subunit
MSTSTATAPQEPVGSRAASNETFFLANRLGSVLAVAPLGVWTLIHLWENLAVFSGPKAWQDEVTGYQHPYGLLVISIIVLLPLLLHAIWGIGRLAKSQPNNVRFGYFGNLRYLLQRIAAVGVLLFIGAHLWLAFIQPRFFMNGAEPFADIAHEMHYNVPTLPVYLLGTLGVAYHLGNGIASIGMGWGLATSKRGMARWQGFGIAFFVLLWAMSWAAVYGLYQAGASF